MRIISGTDGNGRGQCFFSYNHDIQHPYFAPRPGFVRGSVKYHGMVGVVGDKGKTRLTWLVNFDWGGLLPSLFTSQILVSLMIYPISTVDAVEKYKQSSAQKGDGNARGEVRGDGTEVEPSLSTSALLETIAGLKAQLKKDASTIAGLQRQAKRDASTISEDILKISGLEEEVSTLRRRLARRGAGVDDERSDE